MYDRIKTYIKDDPLGFCLVLLSAAVLLYWVLFYSFGGTDRSPAYNTAGKQLEDIEGQRGQIETGLKDSQRSIESVSSRLAESQRAIDRAEARYSSAEDLFGECEQILAELKRRAEARAAKE